MKESLERLDYRSYEWGTGERVLCVGKAAGAVCLLAWFFYRSVLAVVPLSVTGVLCYRMLREQKKERLKEALTEQFKECILSVASSLKAGYAVENAFLESQSDIRLLYGEASPMYRELELIRRGLVLNITLEEQLSDLAARADCEDIAQFSEIFVIAKRSGGSLPEIIRASAELIGQRIETRKELQTVLSGRRMEQNIMRVIPFGLLLYIGMSTPGYFDSLYHNLQGIAVMTVCLVLYLAAWVLGDKILLRIEREM